MPFQTNQIYEHEKDFFIPNTLWDQAIETIPDFQKEFFTVTRIGIPVDPKDTLEGFILSPSDLQHYEELSNSLRTLKVPIIKVKVPFTDLFTEHFDINEIPTFDVKKKRDELLDQFSKETDPTRKEKLMKQLDNLKNAKQASDPSEVAGIGYGGDRPGIAVAPKRDEDVSLQAGNIEVGDRTWEVKPIWELREDGNKLLGYDFYDETQRKVLRINTNNQFSMDQLQEILLKEIDKREHVNASYNGKIVKIASINIKTKEATIREMYTNKFETVSLKKLALDLSQYPEFVAHEDHNDEVVSVARNGEMFIFCPVENKVKRMNIETPTEQPVGTPEAYPIEGKTNTPLAKNGPSDEEINAKAWEMYHEHWNALGTKEQDAVYKALGVDASLTRKAAEVQVVMPKDEFIKEHEKLVKELEDPKPEELKKEKEEQSKELKEVKEAAELPEFIRKINKAVSGHGYEATEYDLRNGSFKANIPLGIGKGESTHTTTRVRLTDPTMTQYEKYYGVSWQMITEEEFNKLLEEWKKIKEMNYPMKSSRRLSKRDSTVQLRRAAYLRLKNECPECYKKFLKFIADKKAHLELRAATAFVKGDQVKLNPRWSDIIEEYFGHMDTHENQAIVELKNRHETDEDKLDSDDVTFTIEKFIREGIEVPAAVESAFPAYADAVEIDGKYYLADLFEKVRVAKKADLTLDEQIQKIKTRIQTVRDTFQTTGSQKVAEGEHPIEENAVVELIKWIELDLDMVENAYRDRPEVIQHIEEIENQITELEKKLGLEHTKPIHEMEEVEHREASLIRDLIKKVAMHIQKGDAYVQRIMDSSDYEFEPEVEAILNNGKDVDTRFTEIKALIPDLMNKLLTDRDTQVKQVEWSNIQIDDQDIMKLIDYHDDLNQSASIEKETAYKTPRPTTLPPEGFQWGYDPVSGQWALVSTR